MKATKLTPNQIKASNLTVDSGLLTAIDMAIIIERAKEWSDVYDEVIGRCWALNHQSDWMRDEWRDGQSKNRIIIKAFDEVTADRLRAEGLMS